MSSFQERLKQLRGRTSQASFAKIVGVPQTTLGRYERGDSQPDIAFSSHICLALNVNPSWLLLGKGPMYQTPQPDDATGEEQPARETHGGACCEMVTPPMVAARFETRDGAFQIREMAERKYAFCLEFLQCKGTPSSMVLMRATGDSMAPYIRNGDSVLIDQSQRDTLPGKIYAVTVEGMVYLKEVNAAPGRLIFTSYNAAYPPLEVDARSSAADDVRIIGRAVWVGRELS